MVFLDVIEAHQLPPEQVELPGQGGVTLRAGGNNVHQAVLLVECIFDNHAAKAVGAERRRPLYLSRSFQDSR